MSKQYMFRRIISVMLILALAISIFPGAVYAAENAATISFSIDGAAYHVGMKIEGDVLYCRADQWAKAAGCLWTFNSDQQKVLFYYDDPVVLAIYDNQTYISDGSDMWVPFFDAAVDTGVYISKVSGFTIYGYRPQPLAAFYKDLDRMFAVSKYRSTEMILELDEAWLLASSASRSYAILSQFSIKGFVDAITEKMDQDMYDKVFIDMLKTDQTLLGAISDLGDELNRYGEVIHDIQESLEEEGVLVEFLTELGYSENEIREIVWELSKDAYGSKTLNDLADFYTANELFPLVDVLKLVDEMTVCKEADAHTVMAMQEVFLDSDNPNLYNAAEKALAARLEGMDKVSAVGKYTLKVVGDHLWSRLFEEVGDCLKDGGKGIDLKELRAKAFTWVLDQEFSLTDTSNAIMYSDVYSIVQLELVNYYYRHKNDSDPETALMMHSVALLYLRACLAALQMFEFDESLAQPIGNATSMLTEEITNLMQYTEEELLQNGTREETMQAITDAVILKGNTQYSDLDESEYLDFLNEHTEYNYYALLDINQDGVSEMLATKKLDHTGNFTSNGEYLDLFVYRDGAISLAYEDIRSQYTPLAYDNQNCWIVSSIGGSGGSGVSFISLDQSLVVQEESFESYCFGVDQDGNEIWTQYYNGIEVNQETQEAYAKLNKIWENSETENIVFQALPKADLIGEWNLFEYGALCEGDTVVSALNLNADGTVYIGLGVVYSEYDYLYSGTWSASYESANQFILDLDVTGGLTYDWDEGISEEKHAEVCIRVFLENGKLRLEKISGDDIGILFYSKEYEKDLQYEEWAGQ